MTLARYVIAQARARGAIVDSHELAIAAQRMLPAGTDADDILHAIDTIAREHDLGDTEGEDA